MRITTQTLQVIGQQFGMVLMTAAATVGILEFADRPSSRVIVPSYSAFAYASNLVSQNENPLRREKEESAPHYISYSVAQRTPGRSGRY